MNKQIVTEIQQEMHSRYPTTDLSRACLYWASITVEILCKHDFSAVLQAGTMMWPKIRPEQDDGKCSTHFSYIFENIRPPIPNVLPEMHVWAGILDTQEIVDLTTRYLPEQCERIINEDWSGDLPPEFLWCSIRDLPKGVIYEANPIATLMAGHLQGRVVVQNLETQNERRNQRTSLPA